VEPPRGARTLVPLELDGDDSDFCDDGDGDDDDGDDDDDYDDDDSMMKLSTHYILLCFFVDELQVPSNHRV
jgi:hypothetical protein